MIHTYKLNGYNIAIDGNSGMIHVLDDLSYAILKDEKELPSINIVNEKLKNEYNFDEIVTAYKEIESLKEQDMLFTQIEELEKAVGTMNINKNLKALCLHVSHDCNLRCEY